MKEIAATNRPATHSGLVLHSAGFYDFLVWLLTFGREREFRERMLRFAQPKPGESVLDVGCGTGSLAIAAKRQVGRSGKVYGLDASPEMISRADKKAKKAGLDIVFKQAFGQSLPFGDAQFNVALSTLMLHHLPRPARTELAREILRILKPGGRVLAIDFGGSSRKRKSIVDFFHRRHGYVELKDMVELFSQAGLEILGSGDVGIRDLQYVLATRA
jgi:ubiquinone/menaquinone biosynthesis C-methylase UbiE